MDDQHTCDDVCGCGPTCLCGGSSVCKYNEGTTELASADAEGDEKTPVAKDGEEVDESVL
ncbi:MAG: hypothetical protein NTV48_00430 [Candidatus Vogelbacteria bacterium]|nr:hypothetical protein [Candidatus Vogelbacteria bacterium]